MLKGLAPGKQPQDFLLLLPQELCLSVPGGYKGGGGAVGPACAAGLCSQGPGLMVSGSYSVLAAFGGLLSL